MVRAARAYQRQQHESQHSWTVAYLCVTVLACACDTSTAGIDANPDDLDGDGVPNATDNCPRASNVDQHDEDGDAFGDACDNCPSSKNPGQGDTTEAAVHAFPDGVGDACDPRTGLSGDTLHAFYSFASDAQASAWIGSGWTISADAAHASGVASWTSARNVQGDGYLVRAEISSLALTAQRSLAITLDGDGVSTGATCTLTMQALAAAEALAASSSVTLASPVVADEPITLIAWRTISLSNSDRIPELTCRVIRGAVTKETSVMLSDELVIGSHVIRANDAVVDMTSLSVYTSPGPKNP